MVRVVRVVSLVHVVHVVHVVRIVSLDYMHSENIWFTLKNGLTLNHQIIEKI